MFLRVLSVPTPRSSQMGPGPASIYTIIAGVVVAGLQVANQLVLASDSLEVWRDIIAVVLGAAAAYGIQPIFGPALTNLLHIPTQVLFFIATAIAGLNGLLTVLAMSVALHTILAGALTLIGAVLFGSPIFQPSPVEPPSPGPVSTG